MQIMAIFYSIIYIQYGAYTVSYTHLDVYKRQEKESSIPEYSETNDGGMTVNIAGDQEGTIVEGSGNEERCV